MCLDYVGMIELNLDLSLMFHNVICASTEIRILQIKDFDSILFSIVCSSFVHSSGEAFAKLLI